MDTDAELAVGWCWLWPEWTAHVLLACGETDAEGWQYAASFQPPEVKFTGLTQTLGRL
jgi:hypothetical protein